ncbi:MAG: serine/threonine protein kinase/tetratricopeptide (TPR) repeat protein [Bradymonadia bacterium]|jgi:serine/threonine protein kinase/tetratricopeptide (TPR) repeat protein
MSTGAQSDVLSERYRLHEELGRGGLGSVWRATDLQSGREVAIKRLHREYSTDVGLQRRLHREARAVARMDHPHIVRLHDVGDDGGAYLVMELVSGHDLTTFAADGPSADQIIDVSEQILGALAYAHARGVIHRDLKPENVLVSRNPDRAERRNDGADRSWRGAERRRPRIKLLDFGFAWVEGDLDEDISLSTREVFGTPHYMAPEQAMRDEAVGPPADLYALAIMVWELFCGAPPFDGTTGASVLMQHLNAPVPAFEPLPYLAVPAGLSAWLNQGLQKDPAQRFHSAGAMRRALASITTRQTPTLEIALPALTSGEMTGLSIDSSLDTGSLNTLPSLGLAASEATAIIGRDELRRWLWRHVVAVCSMPAPPRTILLEGASGAGRSRLCTWLCQTVAEGGWMLVASGRRRVGAPSALRSALRSALSFTDAQPAERLALVRQRLTQLGASDLDPETVVCCLWPETGPCPPASAQRIIEHIVRHLARRQPLLISLDDLHHARASDVELVEHLTVALDQRPAPVLLLCTRRDLPPMGQPSAADARVAGFLKRRVELVHVGRVERLSDSVVEALVQQTLLVHPIVAQHVAHAARGNPLVARQALAWLMESGAIEHDADVGLYRFTGAPPTLPTQPQILITARVQAAFERSRLRVEIRTLCRHLAVVGDTVPFDLVQPLAQRIGIPQATLVVVIDAIVKLGIVVDAADDTLAFASSLFRTVFLAEAAGDPDHAQVQRVVAEVKAEWYARLDGVAASEIALHYLAAEDLVEAARYQLIAAHDARDALRLKLSMARFAEAEQWLSRATPTHLELRREALIGLSDVVLDLRQAERALRLADQLTRLSADDMTGRLTAMAIRGEALLALGRLDAADDVLLRAAQQADVAHAIAARIALARCRLALRRGDLSTAEAHVVAAIQAARHTAPQIEAHGWQVLGEIALKRGAASSAIEALGTAADLIARTYNEPLRGAVHWRLGELHRRGGAFDAAIPHFTAAADAFEAAGNRSSLGRSLRGLGDAQWAVDHRDARQSYRRAIDAFRPLGDGYQLAVCYTQLGRAAMEIGDLDDAEHALERAAAHLEPLDDPLRLGLLHAFRARVAHARGQTAARDQYLQAALRSDAQHPMIVPEWADALERLSEPMRNTQPDLVRRLLARAITIWRALGEGARADRLAARAASLSTQG